MPPQGINHLARAAYSSPLTPSDIFMLDPEPINWCIIPSFPISARWQHQRVKAEKRLIPKPPFD